MNINAWMHEYKFMFLTIFSNIAYYFSRLSQALNWLHWSQKTCLFLNIVKKYVRLQWKKVNVIKLSLLDMNVNLNMPECA